jgi:hypothetical protein
MGASMGGGGKPINWPPFRILKTKKIEFEKSEEIYQILKPKLLFLEQLILLSRILKGGGSQTS